MTRITVFGAALCFGALLASPGYAKDSLPKDPLALHGKGNMINCPTAVKGAKIAVTDTADGVEINVTAESDAAVSEIHKRSQHLVAASKAHPETVMHNGDGHGGGGLGQCLVVLKDTTVSAEEIKGGSKLTVRPVRAVDLDWLHKEMAVRSKGKGPSAKKM